MADVATSATTISEFRRTASSKSHQMPLHCLTIKVSSPLDPSYVSDILFELGALSVTVTDQNQNTSLEQPIYGEPPQNGILYSKSPPLWCSCTITSLYPLSQSMEILHMLIATHFNLPETPTFRMHTDIFDEKTPDVWVREVQQSFKPIIVDKVRISFPWHHRVDQLLDVRLEPGLAFGTGEHPTTKLCIRWLQKVIKPNMSVLDFGTGSGILAIVAATLEDNVTAVGVDVDTVALEVAVSNAKNNNVEHRVTFCHASDEVPDQYDVVVANILAGPLKDLGNTLVSRMKAHTRIALSGVLVSQAAELVEFYQQYGILLEESIVQDGWALLVSSKI